MKKTDFRGMVVLLVVAIAVVLVGLLVLSPLWQTAAKNEPFPYSSILFTILSVGFGIIIFELIYQLMHVAGAKLGKYKVISVNVIGFNFYKNNEGKWKFRFHSFEGLLGDTIVEPIKENNEYISKPRAMLVLPNLTLAAILLITVILSSLFYASNALVAAICVVLALVSGCLLFYNFLPIELDSKTDGYQNKIANNKGNIIAYNEALRIAACEFQGTDPGETELFTVLTDYTADINMNTCYKYLEAGEYYEAQKIVNYILDHKDDISEKKIIIFKAHKLFCYLVAGKYQEGKKYYFEEMTNDERRFIANDDNMVSLRTYILVSGTIETSENEIQYATMRADKAFKKVPALRKETEKKLYATSLKIVGQLHPTWELIIKE